MDRNEAIKIMLQDLENLQVRADSHSSRRAARIYFEAYQDATRNLLRCLAAQGAFDDGRNMTDRMPPRLEYKKP